ncbi:MAG: molybdopterin-dependent oxidoreductase [Pirellulales bacterium]|nr:molybdopterin-dependent oxidoreductase [Pirellulales bacterium]
MRHAPKFLASHRELTRRYFLKAGGLALTAGAVWPRRGFAEPEPNNTSAAAEAPEPVRPKAALGDGIKGNDKLLTPQELFFDVSRGDPLPHALPDDKKTEVGLTRETWKLEVVSDPEHPVPLRSPLTKEKNRALDFAALLQLADKHAVRFVKAMTCLNLGCPLGFGLWEGVPLREVVRLAEPRDNLRRVFYYGYHNDQPEQMFRSSLPIGRIFEDYFDLPPVILCYKLNGQWLSAERGGPVRVVVPEHYGYKSVKWLTHVVLTELSYANDTYAEQGNDIDSPMKTFAATIDVPTEVKAGDKIPITGYAQVGIGGLSKVQAWIQPAGERVAGGERDGFASAPWVDMEILAPPQDWGGELPDGKIPLRTLGFDAAGQPQTWPMKLAVVHWAGILPGLSPGNYTLRCRAIDERGHAQPFPRPYRRSGHAAIEQRKLVVN